MSIIQKLSIEIALETLLIETVRNGIAYAELKRKANTNYERHTAHEGMAAASDILASILPAVCPAQAQKAFESIEALQKYTPYGHIGMEAVEEVIDIAKTVFDRTGTKLK